MRARARACQSVRVCACGRARALGGVCLRVRVCAFEFVRVCLRVRAAVYVCVCDCALPINGLGSCVCVSECARACEPACWRATKHTHTHANTHTHTRKCTHTSTSQSFDVKLPRLTLLASLGESLFFLFFGCCARVREGVSVCVRVYAGGYVVLCVVHFIATA